MLELAKTSWQFLMISQAHHMHYAQCLDHLRISWRFHIISQAHRMHYAHWLHPQKLSPETLTSAWHRLEERSEASGAAKATASWSMSHMWHRPGEGTEVSRTGQATMHCSVTSAWRRPGGGPRALVESGEAAANACKPTGVGLERCKPRACHLPALLPINSQSTPNLPSLSLMRRATKMAPSRHPQIGHLHLLAQGLPADRPRRSHTVTSIGSRQQEVWEVLEAMSPHLPPPHEDC